MKAGVLHAHAPAEVMEGIVAVRVHLDDSSADNGPLPLLVHASSKSAFPRPRRVLHIEYARTLDVGSGLELAIA